MLPLTNKLICTLFSPPSSALKRQIASQTVLFSHFLSVSSESPTVMLAAGSFSSPYEHLSQPETKRMVEHYTAYLSDNTRLIANPGLKVHKHGTTNATLTPRSSL